MKEIFQTAVLSALLSLGFAASASASLPGELREGVRFSLSALEWREATWLINYPGLNGERGCIVIDVKVEPGSTFDLSLFRSQIQAYDGARLLFGRIDYAVQSVPVYFSGTNSIKIPLASINAYQTGFSIQTAEIGENFSELILRSAGGAKMVDVVLRLDRCPAAPNRRF